MEQTMVFRPLALFQTFTAFDVGTSLTQHPQAGCAFCGSPLQQEQHTGGDGQHGQNQRSMGDKCARQRYEAGGNQPNCQ